MWLCQISEIRVISSLFPYLEIAFFLFNDFFYLVMPHGLWISFPDQKTNLCPQQWKHRILTAGPPGKSLGQIFHGVVYCRYWASQAALVVENQPTSAGDIRDVSSIPGLGRSPGGGLGQATHSSILAWRIQRTEEPGGLQSMGSQKVGHD